MFSENSEFKFAFAANFTKKPIDELRMSTHVDLKHVFFGYEGSHTFKRRRLCPECKGTGGLEGQCEECVQCGGSGRSRHLLFRNNGTSGDGGDAMGTYSQMTETACGRCKGRGCVPVGRCKLCGGAGLTLEQVKIAFSLPVGFAHGFKFMYPEEGHQVLDGRKGDAGLTINYRVPSGLTVDEASSTIEMKMDVPISQLLSKNFHHQVFGPAGDLIDVGGSLPCDCVCI